MSNDQNLNPWPESTMSVRFSDCDMYGHLNNIWYLKYFLDAREEHIARSYGLSLAHFARLGVGWVVSSNQIAYLRPAMVNEEVIIRSALIDFTPQDLLVEMQMTDVSRTQLKSVMWSRFVHIGLKDGKRAAHDPKLVTLFEQLRQGGYRYDEFERRVGDIKSLMPVTERKVA